jgi:hypothetical protein
LVEALPKLVEGPLALGVTAEDEALKVTEEDPAGIVVEAGTVTAALLLDRAVRAPPAGAGPERVIVHVVEVPPITVVGAH